MSRIVTPVTSNGQPQMESGADYIGTSVGSLGDIGGDSFELRSDPLWFLGD